MSNQANLSAVDWSKIPKPKDDGEAVHLWDMRLPSCALPATDGTQVDLSALKGRTVLYAYPRTGRPDVPLPEGWDLIPGARGCTPQSCGFRDHFAELQDLGVDHLYGLSVQTTAYQQEAVERLHLPFPLLSDVNFALTTLLRLPTLEAQGKTLLARLSLIIENGTITDVIYPVFPPDRNAELIIKELKA